MRPVPAQPEVRLGHAAADQLRKVLEFFSGKEAFLQFRGEELQEVLAVRPQRTHPATRLARVAGMPVQQHEISVVRD